MRDFFRDLGCRGDAFEVFGHVETDLVERQELDDRRVFGEDFPDLQRDRFKASKRGFTKIRSGHFRFVVIDGIAECTPIARAP